MSEQFLVPRFKCPECGGSRFVTSIVKVPEAEAILDCSHVVATRLLGDPIWPIGPTEPSEPSEPSEKKRIPGAVPTQEQLDDCVISGYVADDWVARNIETPTEGGENPDPTRPPPDPPPAPPDVPVAEGDGDFVESRPMPEVKLKPWKEPSLVDLGKKTFDEKPDPPSKPWDASLGRGYVPTGPPVPAEDLKLPTGGSAVERLAQKMEFVAGPDDARELVRLSPGWDVCPLCHESGGVVVFHVKQHRMTFGCGHVLGEETESDSYRRLVRRRMRDYETIGRAREELERPIADLRRLLYDNLRETWSGILAGAIDHLKAIQDGLTDERSSHV